MACAVTCPCSAARKNHWHGLRVILRNVFSVVIADAHCHCASASPRSASVALRQRLRWRGLLGQAMVRRLLPETIVVLPTALSSIARNTESRTTALRLQRMARMPADVGPVKSPRTSETTAADTQKNAR